MNRKLIDFLVGSIFDQMNSILIKLSEVYMQFFIIILLKLNVTLLCIEWYGVILQTKVEREKKKLPLV